MAQAEQWTIRTIQAAGNTGKPRLETVGRIRRSHGSSFRMPRGNRCA